MRKSVSEINVKIKEDLKVKIINETKAYIDRANEHYGFDMPMPQVEFKLTGTTAGMACYIGHRGRPYQRVRYNIDMAAIQPELFIEETVAHEVAHLVINILERAKMIQRGSRSHGSEWKKVMKVFHAARQDIEIFHHQAKIIP